MSYSLPLPRALIMRPVDILAQKYRGPASTRRISSDSEFFYPETLSTGELAVSQDFSASSVASTHGSEFSEIESVEPASPTEPFRVMPPEMIKKFSAIYRDCVSGASTNRIEIGYAVDFYSACNGGGAVSR